MFIATPSNSAAAYSRLEHRDRVVGVPELEEHQAVGAVDGRVLPISMQLPIAWAEHRCGFLEWPYCKRMFACTRFGISLHPCRREELDDLAQAAEAPIRFLAPAELGERTDDGCARLRLAPAVTDVLEQLRSRRGPA